MVVVVVVGVAVVFCWSLVWSQRRSAKSVVELGMNVGYSDNSWVGAQQRLCLADGGESSRVA